jgi:hypothetical protein
MVIKLDFSNVQTFGPRDPGNYPATISKIEQKVGKDSGKPYLEFEFNVEAGGKAWRNYSLQDNAIWAIKSLLISLGVPEEKLNKSFSLEPRELVGKQVVLVIATREYNGRQSDEVTDVLSPEAAAGAAW